MYTPSAYRNDNRQSAFDFVAQYGFATLVANNGGSVASAHLPMIADSERNVLRGHLARANPYCELLDGVRHLAVFVGANAYVSPDWYGDAEQVPTWNYSAVHIAGASLPTADFLRWRDEIEATHGPRAATVQGTQGMAQWIAGAQMLRLTWRARTGRVETSVSIVDGPVLDGWNLGDHAPARIAKPRPPG